MVSKYNRQTYRKEPFRKTKAGEGNIKMDLKEVGINTSNWVDSAQGMDYWKALVNAALNFQVP